jgi:hypothetical protein
MAEDALTRARIEVIRNYFRRVDARDPSLLDLFADDVEFFFPKFGPARGKEALVTFGERMTRHLASLEHDIDGLNFIVAGDTIAVEGKEWGVTQAGVQWPDGAVSQGLFCNVFEFDGLLIRRTYIYVDPDFTSEDLDRARILRGEVAA